MTARLPSLNGLRAFEAAARHMSFTQAASELNVTQTAISHQIKRLEEELGVRLFIRQNRALSLTPEAKDYLPGIRAAFNDLRLATEEADVAVGDAVMVEPFDGVAHGDRMTPVDVQPVRDDADPDAGVGQPPQGIGGTGDDRHRADHVVLGDGGLVQQLVLAGCEAPLVEVPRPIERQRIDRDAAQLADDLTKPSGVVGDHPVEVDAEHELLIHVHSLPSRLLSATRATSPRAARDGGG